MKKETRILLIGCGSTLLIIIALFIIRAYKEDWLDINIQWIGIAVLPLILALIVGRFIKKFSGFGVELELASDEPLSSTTGIVEFIQYIFPEEKDSLRYLQSLPTDKKRKTNVLLFRTGKKNYYQTYIIQDYIRQLPNIKYFEVTDSKGKFKSISLVDRSLLLIEYENNVLQSFVRAIEENRINNIVLETTTELIFLSETAIEVYKKINSSGKSFIAVVDKENNLIGVVLKTRLEKYFSELVLSAVDKKI
ncbi:MAG TPA: hypothetical protein VIJ95_12300 [Hanamia sp.]